MTSFLLKIAGVLVAVAISFSFVGAYKSTSTVQRGYQGVGMEVNEKNDRLIQKAKDNKVPPALPAASQEGQLSIDAYKNVQVLGHITSGEMTRLMTAMTIWVAPKQGCAYCHAPQKDANGNIVKDADGNPQADANNLYSDDLYTKRVARRMIQMTMHINSNWKAHVQATGVTCYTCHRGNPVPINIWYDEPDNTNGTRAVGNTAGQNKASALVGLTALPSDVLRPYLSGDEGIRVQSTEALPIDNRLSIKQTEWTYGLMMHFSGALGVNCTYCHNTRSMGLWDASPASRNIAWHGIRMARDLNNNYLEPLLSNFPPERLGPTGDAPKLNCATCHNGAFKPLLGVSMLQDYTVLAEAKPQPQKTPVVVPTDPNAPPGTEAPGGTPVPGAAVPATEQVPGAAPVPGAVVPGATPSGAAPGSTPGAVVPVTPAPLVTPPPGTAPVMAPTKPAAGAPAPTGAAAPAAAPASAPAAASVPGSVPVKAPAASPAAVPATKTPAAAPAATPPAPAKAPAAAPPAAAPAKAPAPAAAPKAAPPPAGNG